MFDNTLGRKDDGVKLRWTLLPIKAVEDIVDVLEYGAAKYAVDNWRHLDNARDRYLNAAIRHIVQVMKGENYDKESLKHHLAHAVCSLLFILEKE